MRIFQQFNCNSQWSKLGSAGEESPGVKVLALYANDTSLVQHLIICALTVKDQKKFFLSKLENSTLTVPNDKCAFEFTKGVWRGRTLRLSGECKAWLLTLHLTSRSNLECFVERASDIFPWRARHWFLISVLTHNGVNT